MSHIYLDYASTTPLDPKVWQAMQAAAEHHGNPSSVHYFGQNAKQHLETAREQLARAMGCKPRDLAFSAGGSDANAMAILGVALAAGKGHIVSSAIEHSSVLTTLHNLKRLGFSITLLQPDQHGMISPQQLLEALQPDTILVSLMQVNNELGIVYPIEEYAQICSAKNVCFHTDAVQAFGSVDGFKLHGDLVSVAAHKFYGPKGIGALYHRRGLELFPLVAGKQEQGFRGGTENLVAAVGMGAAAQLLGGLPLELESIAQLRDQLWQGIAHIDGIKRNGGPNTTAKHLNVSVEGVDGEGLLFNLDQMGVAVSSGSACASGSLEPSHVLLALGHNKQLAKASVRFSLGRFNSQQDIVAATQAFIEACTRARL